jgi:hypothetical protein
MRFLLAVTVLVVLAECVASKAVKRDGAKKRSRRDIVLKRIRRDPLYSGSSEEKVTDLLSQYGYDYGDYDSDPDEEPINKLPELKRPGEEDAKDANNRKSNVTEMYLKDPCVSVRCSGGAMCIVKDLEKRITACECPRSCPLLYKPVCSIWGIQYDSKCHLHMQACRQRQYIQIAYEAACISKSQMCTNIELEMFPSRFLDWSLMVRDEEYLGKAKLHRNALSLPDGTQLHIAEWIFNKFDTNGNKVLDKAEQMEIQLLMLSVEKCVSKWLISCDKNRNRKISANEWKICLLPGSNVSDESYFNKLYEAYE